MMTEEYKGTQIEVEPIEVSESKELWNDYILADGALLAIKNVLLTVTKSVDKINGEYIYFTRCQTISKVK